MKALGSRWRLVGRTDGFDISSPREFILRAKDGKVALWTSDGYNWGKMIEDQWEKVITEEEWATVSAPGLFVPNEGPALAAPGLFVPNEGPALDFLPLGSYWLCDQNGLTYQLAVKDGPDGPKLGMWWVQSPPAARFPASPPKESWSCLVPWTGLVTKEDWDRITGHGVFTYVSAAPVLGTKWRRGTGIWILEERRSQVALWGALEGAAWCYGIPPLCPEQKGALSQSQWNTVTAQDAASFEQVHDYRPLDTHWYQAANGVTFHFAVRGYRLGLWHMGGPSFCGATVPWTGLVTKEDWEKVTGGCAFSACPDNPKEDAMPNPKEDDMPNMTYGQIKKQVQDTYAAWQEAKEKLDYILQTHPTADKLEPPDAYPFDPVEHRIYKALQALQDAPDRAAAAKQLAGMVREWWGK